MNANLFRDEEFTNKYQVSLDITKKFQLLRRKRGTMNFKNDSDTKDQLNKKKSTSNYFINLLNRHWFKD